MKYFRFYMAICLLTMPLLSFKPADVAYPVYNGTDLGVRYTAQKTSFKVWAPNAEAVKLRLYAAGDGGGASESIDLQKQADGVWLAEVLKDIKNKYYTFQVLQNGKWLLEAPDIYAKAVGVNGKRGMVVNLPETNPHNWAADKKPALKNPTDIIIYETHLRDISVSPNSGIKNKGKFLGLTELNTKSPEGLLTGLSHIKELGVTHVHILPAFDYASVDESKPAEGQYNWGYDPLNYNVPEGSYATDPYDGNTRIREFKQMVQAMHANGLRVILDVVYNHTNDTQNAGFNQFAPFYFYRQTATGAYSNGTGCGNETASERAMMRNFMVQSVAYWAREYHLDGFRFDLMGVHDIATMNAISDTLHKIDPTLFIYGEGWTAGDSPLPEAERAVKSNAAKLNNIAVFGDEMRDGLKGGWSDVKSKGFVSSQPGTAESVKFGIVGATPHPQVNYKGVNYSKAAWAAQPGQAISYVSCHDDNTLFDRLKISNPTATEAELIKMDKLANTVVLTSQGVAFLHSGAELLRTKKGVANSFKSPDSINQIDWSRKSKYLKVFKYYQGLVHLRKNHPAFRMPSTQMIQTHLRFLDTANKAVIAYHINGHANGDTWSDILVVLNGSTSPQKIKIPAGSWALAADGEQVNEKGISTLGAAGVTIPATTGYIMYKKNKN